MRFLTLNLSNDSSNIEARISIQKDAILVILNKPCNGIVKVVISHNLLALIDVSQDPLIEHDGLVQRCKLLHDEKAWFLILDCSRLQYSPYIIRFKSKKWVNVVFEEFPRWKKTLQILSVNNARLSPSYVHDANLKLQQETKNLVDLSVIANFIMQELFLSESDLISLGVFMEWLAGIIVLGKTPRFSEIRGPSPVKTPILPFKIHSADMAELLGIWSSDGSLTYVHDHTNDKIIPTFIVTNRDEAFLKTLDGLIRRIVGEINISVDKSYKTKNQFRIRNKIFIDILRDAGAVAGRKADLFTNIGVPRWIKKNTEYIIRWFRGVLECDGDVKISHKKRTYAVRYSRNISINLPEEIINMLVNRGKRNKLTGSFSAPFGMIKNFDFQVVVPKIISDETKMLQRLFPRDRVRVYKERIFYYPKTKRSTLKWTISINGKNATIQCLKVISPPRLVRKATSKGLLPAIMRSQYLH